MSEAAAVLLPLVGCVSSIIPAGGRKHLIYADFGIIENDERYTNLYTRGTYESRVVYVERERVKLHRRYSSRPQRFRSVRNCCIFNGRSARNDLVTILLVYRAFEFAATLSLSIASHLVDVGHVVVTRVALNRLLFSQGFVPTNLSSFLRFP